MGVILMSSIRKDFFISHLRLQLDKMRNILNNLEEDADCDYASQSLKEVELNLRQIRKLCVEGF